MMESYISDLKLLFEQYFGEKPEHISKIPLSGSSRLYFRLQSVKNSAIGTYNTDLRENKAFLSFSRQFAALGMNTPKVYAENLTANVYIQQDLGDESLFSYLEQHRESPDFEAKADEMYFKVLKQLPRLQISGGANFDYSCGYPREAFDKQSIMWDLNYFKYYFLKFAQVSFYEQDLENDYKAFTDFLLQAPSEFFLFRDFQSRNIMIFNNEPYFIDYQGGRKGALQYDLASLLYDAKAGISDEMRTRYLHFYLKEIKQYTNISEAEFMKYWLGFVLIRKMQAMGAYGYRGIFEKKEHFLQSIPPALDNLDHLLNSYEFPIAAPELQKVLHLVAKSEILRNMVPAKKQLTVAVRSFSYKRGIPHSANEHGGGFVFDCRLLPNPGKLEEYKSLNGKDFEVANYLNEKPETLEFLNAIYALTKQSIKTYIEKGFDFLSVSFGCTGGQHRSVYCAEQFAEFLRTNFHVKVEIRHLEQEKNMQNVR